MENFINILKNKIDKEKGLKLIVIIGLIGIGLILLSELIPKNTKPIDTTKNLSEAAAYQKEMQEKLTQILSTISGVGEVNVMLTVSCTEEYVYAEEIKDNNTADAERKTYQNENNFVILDSGDEKEALVSKVLNPQINGVVIVCEGGGSAAVCEKIYKSVSTVLGIPTNKIYVTKIK